MISLLESNENPVTLFAPTNSAFENYLFDEEPVECLKEIIESHIVDGIFCSVAAGLFNLAYYKHKNIGFFQTTW